MLVTLTAQYNRQVEITILLNSIDNKNKKSCKKSLLQGFLLHEQQLRRKRKIACTDPTDGSALFWMFNETSHLGPSARTIMDR